MRYAKIFDVMWENPAFIALPMQAKLGYTYLCSCSHCNQIGYFRLPLAYMATDMGIDVREAAKVMKALEAGKFILFNPDTSRVLIISYLKWNAPASGSNVTAMAKVFDDLPEDNLDATFLHIADRVTTDRGLLQFSRESARSSGMASKKQGNQDSMPVDTPMDTPMDTPVVTPQDAPEDIPEVSPQKQEQKQKQKDSSLRSLAPSCDDDAAPSAPTTPQPDPSQDVLLVMPCTGAGGRTWNVTRGYLDGLRDTYPGIDLMAECRKAKAWLDANPRRLKTYSGMKAFLTSWFSRAQNRLGSCLPYSQQRGTSSLPDSVIHTEDAWAGQKGGKISFGGSR